MSGLTHLSERAVEAVIEQIAQSGSIIEIKKSLNHDQLRELHILMWFGTSDNANLGFAWHRDRYQAPLDLPVHLCGASLRRGLFRLRAETKLVYIAA